MSWGLTDVTKRYGDAVALDHAGIDVQPGAISAVVGGAAPASPPS